MSGVQPLPYSELPPTYHRWKWRILLSFCCFYLFLYLGRFNFWPVAPLVQEDLALSHLEIGLINALLLWGFGLLYTCCCWFAVLMVRGPLQLFVVCVGFLTTPVLMRLTRGPRKLAGVCGPPGFRPGASSGAVGFAVVWCCASRAS